MKRATVIVSFYKKVDILKLVLAGLERQTERGYEIIIADDGSPEQVVEEIHRVITNSPLEIRHVWHEDDGFRKTTILNEAIRRSATGYLIFTDGDCIPHPRFVEAHLADMRPATVLAGRRVSLSPKLSATLTEEKVRAGHLEGPFTRSFLLDGLLGRTRHWERGIYLTSPWIRGIVDRKEIGILGCNWSIHKADILSVNGFDERYQAPAVGEDTDIELRLRWSGIRIKTIQNTAIQYHLFHPPLPRAAENTKIYEEVLKQHLAFTPYGIVRDGAPLP